MKDQKMTELGWFTIILVFFEVKNVKLDKPE